MWSVLFVFLSYLDRDLARGDLLDADKRSKVGVSALHGTFCAKTSAAGVNLLYQVTDGAAVVRSVVSPAGKLLSCSVTAKPLQVRSFLQQCRSGQRGQVPDAPFTRMEEAKETCHRFTQRSERDAKTEDKEEEGELKEVEEEGDSPVQDPVLKRSKRGFTYPGTLWCGAGNMADHYDQLGQFAQTDSCCRTHDHCPHCIHAFSSKYGHTNFKWHSICQCECDQTLRSCLRKVNDSSSRIVGQAFFNVIGVPCFDLTYEEHCAEREWYGACKRYEKRPIAVIREATPYDFGGIAVIDELTVAPPLGKDLGKAKEEKKEEEEMEKEEEKPEIPPQPTVSGPEPPSLTNVVTAAEDFIKVLATVSSSQGSTADSDKGETQSSEEKKKRKRKKKKKQKTPKKHKGKGGKRKHKGEAAVGKPDEVSPGGGKPGEVASLSNFVGESRRHDESRPNHAGDNEYEMQDREETSNEVMKDEPAMDKETVSVTSSPTTIRKKSHTDTLTTIIIPTRAEPRKLKMQSKKLPPPLAEEADTTPSDVTLPTIVPIMSTAQPRQQSLDSDPEKRPTVSAAAPPPGILKVKRNRSKERGARAGKRKKTGPIDAAGHENSSEDNLRVAPHAGTLVLAEGTSEASHWPDIYGGKRSKPSNSSFSVLKMQRSKVRGLRRRKTTLPLVPDLAAPAPTTPAITAEITTEKLGTQSDWRLFTTAPPAASTKQHWPTIRRQRKSKQKVVPTPGEASVTDDNKHTTVTFLTTSPPVTPAHGPLSEGPHMTASPPTSMSPARLTIEKVRAQFIRKKRRKAAALSLRQLERHSTGVS